MLMAMGPRRLRIAESVGAEALRDGVRVQMLMAAHQPRAFTPQ